MGGDNYSFAKHFASRPMASESTQNSAVVTVMSGCMKALCLACTIWRAQQWMTKSSILGSTALTSASSRHLCHDGPCDDLCMAQHSVRFQLMYDSVTWGSSRRSGQRSVHAYDECRARKNPIGWPGIVALESTQRGSCDDDMHMDDFSFNTAMTDPCFV